MTKIKKVLLVEDDPFLMDIYTLKFKEAGFQISGVQDGGEALQKIKELSPDILILDIVLPSLDGWEILRKVKSEKRFNKLKVVILSNLGQQKEIEKGISLGALRYFIKAHYTPSQIVQEINKILKSKN